MIERTTKALRLMSQSWDAARGQVFIAYSIDDPEIDHNFFTAGGAFVESWYPVQKEPQTTYHAESFACRTNHCQRTRAPLVSAFHSE
jgi:hypothetical protein